VDFIIRMYHDARSSECQFIFVYVSLKLLPLYHIAEDVKILVRMREFVGTSQVLSTQITCKQDGQCTYNVILRRVRVDKH
jgi:hypothetical protein